MNDCRRKYKGHGKKLSLAQLFHEIEFSRQRKYLLQGFALQNGSRPGARGNKAEGSLPGPFGPASSGKGRRVRLSSCHELPRFGAQPLRGGGAAANYLWIRPGRARGMGRGIIQQPRAHLGYGLTARFRAHRCTCTNCAARVEPPKLKRAQPVSGEIRPMEFNADGTRRPRPRSGPALFMPAASFQRSDESSRLAEARPPIFSRRVVTRADPLPVFAFLRDVPVWAISIYNLQTTAALSFQE